MNYIIDSITGDKIYTTVELTSQQKARTLAIEVRDYIEELIALQNHTGLSNPLEKMDKIINLLG